MLNLELTTLSKIQATNSGKNVDYILHFFFFLFFFLTLIAIFKVFHLHHHFFCRPSDMCRLISGLDMCSLFCKINNLMAVNLILSFSHPQKKNIRTHIYINFYALFVAYRSKHLKWLWQFENCSFNFHFRKKKN